MDLIYLFIVLIALPIAVLFTGIVTVVLGVILLALFCGLMLVCFWLVLELFRFLFVGNSRG